MPFYEAGGNPNAWCLQVKVTRRFRPPCHRTADPCTSKSHAATVLPKNPQARGCRCVTWQGRTVRSGATPAVRVTNRHTGRSRQPWCCGWNVCMIGDDGVERVTRQCVLDLLEVPQRARRSGAYRRLAKLMAELGWTAVSVRGLTRDGYLEQVRGFARCRCL
jgi:hypothetical protein